uniref:Secreted protein n=1 Tax=Steinernema glaseri TaxID=37863 RepID=A0A1I7ZII3_9BILA
MKGDRCDGPSLVGTALARRLLLQYVLERWLSSYVEIQMKGVSQSSLRLPQCGQLWFLATVLLVTPYTCCVRGGGIVQIELIIHYPRRDGFFAFPEQTFNNRRAVNYARSFTSVHSSQPAAIFDT